MLKEDLVTIILIVIIIAIVGAGIYILFPKNNPVETQATPTPTAQPNMKIETLKPGEGPGAKAGDKVTVNYVGTLTNGTKFDSSIDRGQPFSFTLGQNSVIQGWEMGILGMKVGEKRKLTIPPELGYGSQANGPIPANSTLIFEVDMLSINK